MREQGFAKYLADRGGFRALSVPERELEDDPSPGESGGGGSRRYRSDPRPSPRASAIEKQIRSTRST